MQELMKKRAIELLADGTCDRVLGWEKGDFAYDQTPALFHTAEELRASFVYNGFSAANLSKYLVKECRAGGKIAVFLKPCDTYSFNQLLAEHRIKREMIYVIGVACDGKADVEKLKDAGIDGITDIREEGECYVVSTIYGDKTVKKAEALAERCLNCKSRKHMAYDELIGESGEVVPNSGRFDMVEQLEAMTPDERYEFWRGELSRCIRCNACRNVCPACTCEQCIFDNPKSGVAQKAAVNSFEENMFHIIRAFHVAGRCTDCGECSRVCPEHIPLHLLNRKFIKDVNSFYGEYQAGEDPAARPPLGRYEKNDIEPGEAGGNRA
ncbi:MAG: 4Fe-4S dicluster domain-containing protein [Clostridia bacterium]|nr:4Fe-4S dicluster domain-containing protein [Clostridia bacterium]MBR7111600.1 4Fe-4S dicluster domain-containing protein [Clostridia bacterium]